MQEANSTKMKKAQNIIYIYIYIYTIPQKQKSNEKKEEKRTMHSTSEVSIKAVFCDLGWRKMKLFNFGTKMKSNSM